MTANIEILFLIIDVCRTLLKISFFPYNGVENVGRSESFVIASLPRSKHVSVTNIPKIATFRLSTWADRQTGVQVSPSGCYLRPHKVNIPCAINTRNGKCMER